MVMRRRGSGSSRRLMRPTTGALRPYSSGTVTPTLWMRLVAGVWEGWAGGREAARARFLSRLILIDCRPTGVR
jgi:hypothetical protein